MVRYIGFIFVLLIAIAFSIETSFKREVRSDEVWSDEVRSDNGNFDAQNISRQIDSFRSNVLVLIFRNFYQKVVSSYAGVESCSISVSWLERKLIFKIKVFNPVYTAFFQSNFYSVDPFGRKALAQLKPEEKPDKKIVYVNDHLTYESIESSFLDFIQKTQEMGFGLCYAAISDSLVSVKFCGFPVLRIYFVDYTSFQNLATTAATKVMAKLDPLSKFRIEEITLNFDQSLTVSFDANSHNN